MILMEFFWSQFSLQGHWDWFLDVNAWNSIDVRKEDESDSISELIGGRLHMLFQFSRDLMNALRIYFEFICTQWKVCVLFDS